MSATQKLFPTTRTERQIQRWLGIGPWALTPAAIELFVRRRRVRLWLQWGIAAPALAALGVMLWNRDSSFDTHATAFGVYGFRTGLALALFGAAVVVLAEIRRLLDRRIAASLPTRVTRLEHVPVITVLGRVRAACLAVALLVDLAFAVALFAVRRHDIAAYRWGYVCAFAFCALSAVVGVAREVTRPAMAPDSASLAIDERMRSQEAFAAIAPLAILGNLAGYGFLPLTGSGRFSEFAILLPVLPVILWGFASEAKPWPKTEPAPWGMHPAPGA